MIRTFDEYQELATRTAGKFDQSKDAFSDYGLGISGEAGEVANKLKKVFYHGHDLDHDEIALELGDCLWYLSMLATLLGLPLHVIAEMNIEKLKKRYPDGFSSDASINRKE